MIIITNKPERLSGELIMPGDKSITHRALIFGALAKGITEIKGYLDAEDCRSTIKCLRRLGVNISARRGRLLVEGRNMQMAESAKVLDAGNSGTTARLLLGLLAGQPFSAVVTGDISLQKRPMRRVVEPLRQMGATFKGEGEQLPLNISGGKLKGIRYSSSKASAQVKSAVLIAALFAEGQTVYDEPYLSRNHTELMLSDFAAEIKSRGSQVTLEGPQNLKGRQVLVPGDISAAAFFMVAAAINPGAEVLLKNVGINPTRSGIIDILKNMGTDLIIQNKRIWGSEPVADIMIRGGAKLHGIKIDGEIIPRLIDEIPAIAVAAAAAEGKTVIADAGELRVKESDRISAVTSQFTRMGMAVTETEDGLIIEGGSRLKGAEVNSMGDHRIAMALAVAGLAAEGETAVHDAEVIKISFPGFIPALRSLVNKG
ncbi:MAG: 3-phosphoshikimate 1-carboxyvinyltransferase [Bacillota bacterium]|nr:3-phosphoshikimate 1-carboxyvinyltransferase [Bacillota bacterium]MDW7728587.1 3-phosphoshikimate 1-carboxyvinyltransferase [Bacillota bacterium]